MPIPGQSCLSLAAWAASMTTRCGETDKSFVAWRRSLRLAAPFMSPASICVASMPNNSFKPTPLRGAA